ncbi:MAG: T9SS type A sorting domain-containing protein [Marinilabiliaceae bacterium]|nr:T9SS type A sorting domain-containing protein [Marinilabiliaceae bacterium]
MTDGQDQLEEVTTDIVEVKSITDIRIYPNPASVSINLDLSLNEPGELLVKIFNLKGQLAKIVSYEQLSAGDNTLEIDCGDFNSGEYILSIKASDGISSHKVIISK